VVRPESAKLSFVGSIPTRTSILFLCAQLAWGTDPAQLLDRSLAVKRELLPQIKDYLGQEDIRYYRTGSGSRRKQTGWSTYDVFVVEKQRVFRMVARDGKPVKPGKPQAKPRQGEADRIAFQVEDLRTNHTLRLRGEETLLGRRCWVLEATLDPAAPEIVNRSKGMSSSDATLWIDQETHWILKEEARLRRRWLVFPEGSVVTHEVLFHDGLPLTSRIHLQRFSGGEDPKRRVLLETEQTYSNYRRFATETAIQFNPVQ
jgi:hypothetical protein